MNRIFFLVNNNFHLVDMRQHLASLSGAEVNLICVPHTLDAVSAIEGVSTIHTFISPFVGSYPLLKNKQIGECQNKIASALNFTESDILIIYTEYEPINQYVASLLKKANGKVFVLDEGLGTYLTFSQKSEPGMPAKQVLKLLLSRYLFGYRWMKYLHLDGIIFPQMRDDMLDGLISYKSFNCVRSVPVVKINKPHLKELELNENACLFLNSDIYNFYTNWDCYVDELVKIMSHLSKNFPEVHFKFHPREPADVIDKVTTALSPFTNIRFVTGVQPIENSIESIRAKYAVSYVSTSLMNLIDVGVHPIYIFHLMPSTSNSQVSKSLTAIVQSMGITLVESLEGILPGKSYYAHKSVSKDCLTLARALGVSSSTIHD